MADAVHRLNAALACYQASELSQIQTDGQVQDEPRPWVENQQIVAPLLHHYDSQVRQMEDRLSMYAKLTSQQRSQQEILVEENHQLHVQINHLLQTTTAANPAGSGSGLGSLGNQHHSSSETDVGVDTALFDVADITVGEWKDMSERLNLTQMELDLLLEQHRQLTDQNSAFRTESTKSAQEVASLRVQLDGVGTELKAAHDTIWQLETSGEKLAKARAEFRDKFLKIQETEVLRGQQEHLVQQAFATLGAAERLTPLEACDFALEKKNTSQALCEQMETLKSSHATLESSLLTERTRLAEQTGKTKQLDDSRNALLLENDKMRSAIDDMKVDLTRQTAQLKTIVENADGKTRNAVTLAENMFKERQAAFEKEVAAAISKRVESDMRADRCQRVASAAENVLRQSEAALQETTERLQGEIDTLHEKILASERRRDAAELQESHANQRLNAFKKSAELQLNESTLALDVERRTCQSLRAELDAMRKDFDALNRNTEALSKQVHILTDEKQAVARNGTQVRRVHFHYRPHSACVHTHTATQPWWLSCAHFHCSLAHLFHWHICFISQPTGLLCITLLVPTVD